MRVVAAVISISIVASCCAWKIPQEDLEMWNNKIALMAESGTKTCDDICDAAGGMVRELAGIRSGFCRQFMSLGVANVCTSSLKPQLLQAGESFCDRLF
jgi:hypothetical protein